MSAERAWVMAVGIGLGSIPLGGLPPLGADDGVAGVDAPGTASSAWSGAPTRLDVLAGLGDRLSRVEAHAHEARRVVVLELAPLLNRLAPRLQDEGLTVEIALALVREGRRSGLDPLLLLAVMLVENEPMDPQARSSVGAVGLMQVMPFHSGGWGCEGDDLTDAAVNICHAARILAHEVGLSPGNLDRALLRYNGCVRGTNTPSCHLYPSKVRRVLAGLRI